MKIYLDVCCLNRPYDDQIQDRIHLESEAVLTILKHIEAGDWEWIVSSVVLFEIGETPSPERKRRVLKLCEKASSKIGLSEEIRLFAETLKSHGFSTYDALHLACAKQAGVDVFLSTDDKLIKRAQRYIDFIALNVKNPLTWLQEVLYDT
jgi:predicted nucleic acid-binding protein